MAHKDPKSMTDQELRDAILKLGVTVTKPGEVVTSRTGRRITSNGPIISVRSTNGDVSVSLGGGGITINGQHIEVDLDGDDW